MPEILLHYIWQHRLFAAYPQQTDDGQRVEVLSPGIHNIHAGPDFSQARLRINGQELYGDVEIHVRASDWNRHRHQSDPAYNGVILHVVRDTDTAVCNAQGHPVTQCRLNYPANTDYLTHLIQDAQQMDKAFFSIACSRSLLQDPDLLTYGWKKALLYKRLECKKEAIGRLLRITRNNREQAFYITLAHHFGFHTNGIPFEQMAIQTPLPYLLKHRNSLFQLTAILLGQSGLLDSMQTPDSDALRSEYRFLQTKFSLQPINPTLWKRLRMRPQNFPETRIRQFARLLHQSEFLYSRLTEATDTKQMMQLLTLQPLPDKDKQQLLTPPPLGQDAVRSLLINTAVPYMYASGKEAHAFNLLESLPAENNTIIRQWQTLGQQVESAADSQALIHLYMNYCQPHDCLNCDIGYQIFLQPEFATSG